jgi:hypothetical protein
MDYQSIEGLCVECFARKTGNRPEFIWARVGGYAEFINGTRFTGSFAQITEICSQGVTVTVVTGLAKGASLQYPPTEFYRFWRSCDPPSEPLSVWERVVMEDWI